MLRKTTLLFSMKEASKKVAYSINYKREQLNNSEREEGTGRNCAFFFLFFDSLKMLRITKSLM